MGACDNGSKPGKTLVSIELSSAPAKTTYIKGEPLDLTGLAVSGVYSDGSVEPLTVTAEHLSGFDSSVPGEKTVTVTIDGKSVSFKVTVKNDLTGIAVTAPPTKTGYFPGEPLDLAGLVVTATYDDGSTAAVTVTAEQLSGFDSSAPGTRAVTVTYGGKTASFTVTVWAVESLTLTGPAKTVYAVYDKSQAVFCKTALFFCFSRKRRY
jgi:hypothetical protein